MKNTLFSFFIILAPFSSYSQTPVSMASQPALTYFEDFSDIMNWTNGFTSGIGAEHFGAVPVAGTLAIPDPTHTTYTSANFAFSASSGGIHKDTVNYKMMMLATGTADNTTAIAFDFFMNFTGVNAGSLSFDWSSVNNGGSTSNRKGSLRVYASVDGIIFNEIITAQVLNITNYAPANGSIINATFPASFNNNPNARIRFYYYNGTGGTTGSRPLIRLENIKGTASGIPCVIPPSQPTNLVFGTVTATTVGGSFTAASPAPDEYLVVATTNNNLTSLPQDSVAYNLGDNIGDGTLIYRGSGTSFTATGLDPVTTYRFFVFPVNIYCSGMIRYNTTNPLVGIQSTIVGPPCTVPSSQPLNLQFGTVTPGSIAGSFDTALNADEYLVIVSANSSLIAHPADGIVYNAGNAIGGGIVVYRGGGTHFNAINLNPNTAYHFFVFSLNSLICSSGPKYNTINSLTGSHNSGTLFPCGTPSGSGYNLVLTAGEDYINGFFNPYPYDVDGYLVVMSTAASLFSLPQDATIYQTGDNIGGGKVISKGINYSFTGSNLNANTAYYFYIFSYNDICIGAVKYRTGQYLTGSKSTTNNPPYKYYFGNLHAHSSYSDGNKDNSSLTPADDYDFAKNALCMDFLGISEHNHFTATSNPGMLLSKYQPGVQQAADYTLSNPGFLALYGMEWGVISNGGHVLIYGIDSLLGWETISGNKNYDIFVAKSDYLSDTGLFKKVLNLGQSGSVFATLAHPSSHDYENLFYKPYLSFADSAIVGIAVENGPSTSSNTSYTDPGSAMSYLNYYNWMLSKGYHIAPQIDHDNHNTTFGRTAYTRTAVIAASINKADFFEAMKNRRFYATQDCDTRVNLEIFGSKMGSTVTHTFAPAITVNAVDPSEPSSVPIIRIMSGVPGNNINASLIAVDTAYELNYTDLSLKDSATGYYYADIIIAGNRTITAPVWYARMDEAVLAVPETQPLHSGNNSLEIIQNPVSDYLSLEIQSVKMQEVELGIISVSGQKLKKEHFYLRAGKNAIRFSLQDMPTGLYFMEGVFEKERITKKFYVQY